MNSITRTRHDSQRVTRPARRSAWSPVVNVVFAVLGFLWALIRAEIPVYALMVLTGVAGAVAHTLWG